MKTFVLAVLLLGSYQTLAQDVPLLQAAKIQSESEIDLEHETVIESLEATHIALQTAIAQNPMKTTIAHTYARSIVTTGTVQLGVFTTDSFQGSTTQSQLEETLAKLNEKDNMNWKPAFLKYVKQLAEASEDLSQCAPEDIESCLYVWDHIQNRVAHIVDNVKDGTYLTERGPGIYASLEDLRVRLFN